MDLVDIFQILCTNIVKAGTGQVTGQSLVFLVGQHVLVAS